MGTRAHTERQERQLESPVASWTDQMAKRAWLDGVWGFRHGRKTNLHTAGTLGACYWQDGWDHSWREVEYGW